MLSVSADIIMPGLSAETLNSTSVCFGGFYFSIPRCSLRYKIFKKMLASMGNIFDSFIKDGFVGERWFLETRNFSDKLRRCVAHFVARGMRFKIIELLNISTHSSMISKKTTQIRSL
jgi:hypothetical protein